MTADKIKYDMVLVPGEDHNGIPYHESVQWLEQFYPCGERAQQTGRRILLIVGGRIPDGSVVDEKQPLQRQVPPRMEGSRLTLTNR